MTKILLKQLAKQCSESTTSLSDQSKAFAEWIVERMDDLCIKNLCGLKLFHCRTSAGSYESLILNDQDLLSTMGSGSYYEHGDFNHEINRPGRETINSFIDLIPKILIEIERLSAPVEFPDFEKITS